MDPHQIRSLDELESLFDTPGEAAIKKEVDRLVPVYRRLIEASPFFVLATHGAGGLDCSPRGDPAGFVEVLDERRIALPERRGNNRIDSLRNLVEDPRIGLLFLVPGKNETLRVNGRARITTDPTLLERTAMKGKPPQCVIVVEIETVYFQCARALLRAGLWDPDSRTLAARTPSAGEMLAGVPDSGIEAAVYDDGLDERQARTLY
ncbi:pyridoxamine 5'-phosphate oxidase family protein [Guyparkeria hydrothermalis]|uniref:pyridoxamine 5'-phosphate oxidase family protein n=1 Tax=Guyparkeria TaxID=2035712 RepID=UPI0010ABB673|nr:MULTISPECIES: pyridoxamine 5'-phosphate oxidase family protein [Guyparkeria]MCL7751524.1 pyridoxamine 5'-phosphate oxidase family protein [Guyparkeria hydrothermalis]TKA90532.1 pyridoxamine 5'-phosphate oxidase family protein [Guyparkeria sp. SB14A]